MLKSFNTLITLIAKLRGKNGCPWDRKQTLKTIRGNIIEEAYETVDAINKNNYTKLKEETGDLLLQAVFISQLASEKEIFTITDVLKHITDKLVKRHPHIFGHIKVKNTEQVLHNWEQIKKKNNHSKYILNDIPVILPALLKANKVQSKVERFGFKWQDVKYPVKKLKEELNEFIQEIKTSKRSGIEEEFGDILFTLVSISRFYKINPEEALNKTINKFIKRFNYVEKKAKKQTNNPDLVLLKKLWDESKEQAVNKY